MREGKFTDAQKFEIALEMIAGKATQAEVCRKWGICMDEPCSRWLGSTRGICGTVFSPYGGLPRHDMVFNV